MTTCTKLYIDIPFAHRQPNHKGHCSWIHGHNWSFEFTFEATRLDDCGFVVDFGALKPLKDLLLTLDHALVLNSNDPELGYLQRKLNGGEEMPDGARVEHKLAHIVVVQDCSCEGMARWALEHGYMIVQQLTNGRARVIKVTCYEDSKNSATATM